MRDPDEPLDAPQPPHDEAPSYAPHAPCDPGPRGGYSAARVGCVRLRDAALLALYRVDPSLRERPLAVLEPGTAAARIVLASCPAARARGVTPGQTQRQARAIAPDVLLRPLDRGALASTREALYDALSSLSPRVEPDRDRAFFDASPAVVRTRFGNGLAGEGALLASVAAHARRVGLEVHASVADDKCTARAATTRFVGGAVVPQKGSRAFLAPLPLSVLPLSSALRVALGAMGLRNVGDLAALPPADAALRLGPEGARALTWARGDDTEPLFPRPASTRFEERTDLDWELVDLGALVFVLKRLCDPLVARLRARSLGARALTLELSLDGGTRSTRDVALPAPTRDVATLLHLLRASLEAHPPTQSVCALALCAHTEALRPVQLGLFDPPSTAPDRIARTVARVSALVGQDRVGAPVAPATHRPHAAALAPFAIAPRARHATPAFAHAHTHTTVPSASPEPASSQEYTRTEREPLAVHQALLHTAAANRAPARAPEAGPAMQPAPTHATLQVHVVRPPREAHVQLDEHGAPAWITVEGPALLRIHSRVRTYAGPFRARGDWWTQDPFDHEGYDVELDDGRLILLGYDRRRACWRLEGLYE